MTVPSWLADLQAELGRALRTPLDRQTGTLRTATSAYEPRVCAEIRPGPRGGNRERLAVYNLQYWLRFFGLMGKEFPVTARLVGYWGFNGIVTRFLLEHPPSGWDIEMVPTGFEAFLERTTPEWTALEPGRADLPRDALLQAAAIDAAERRIFSSPTQAIFHPSRAQLALLASGKLQLSERIAFVREDWPLLELRRALRDDAGERAVPLPARLAEPRWWALVRTDAGVGELSLVPAEARLFELLREHPLADALARLESTTPADERSELPAKVQRWLARSVALGFWRGLESQ